MKRIYCFDFDNTIYSRKAEVVYDNTLTLLKILSENPENILCLMTGRRPSETKIIENISGYFDYLVFLNGSIIMHQNKIIYKTPLKMTDVLKVFDKSKKYDVPLGFTSLTDEYIYKLNDHSKFRWNISYGYHEVHEKRDLSDKEIYQMWMLEESKDKIAGFMDEFKSFRVYYWHQGGAHFVYKDTSKAKALKIIKHKYEDYKVISVGDGHNDIEMILESDIGIAVASSSDPELLKKADLISYDIDEDRLLEFFTENKLI